MPLPVFPKSKKWKSCNNMEASKEFHEIIEEALSGEDTGEISPLVSGRATPVGEKRSSGPPQSRKHESLSSPRPCKKTDCKGSKGSKSETKLSSNEAVVRSGKIKSAPLAPTTKQASSGSKNWLKLKISSPRSTNRQQGLGKGTVTRGIRSSVYNNHIRSSEVARI